MSAPTSARGAIASIRTRVLTVVPKAMHDTDVLTVALVASLRHGPRMIRTLYGHDIARHLTEKACETVAIRPAELAALACTTRFEDATAIGVSSGRGGGTRCCLSELERNEPLHAELIDRLGRTLETTLAPQRIATAWKRDTTRCAAAIAMRMRDPRAGLEAIVGDITRRDARRLGTDTDDLETAEDASDVHIFPTCIVATSLARSLLVREG